jgi:glycosyltransferase involved in cell wall biosynthesis
MLKILFVIPDLEYSGAARQLTLLASGLPADRFQRRVSVFGSAGPWVETLRAAGVDVDVLGWKRLVDLKPFGALRRVLRSYQADVIHAWRLPALRAVWFAGGRGRLLVSRPLPPRLPKTGLCWWDRWLLRRTERVVVSGPAEAERCRRQGIRDDRLTRIAPGVEAPAGEAASVQSTEYSVLGTLYSVTKTLMGIGPLERHKGFRDAVWALDILRSLHDDLQLILVGDGPDRPAINNFAWTAEVSDRVHLLGNRADVPQLLAGANVVWVLSHTPNGINAALEAMAAGRPVIATRLPELEEIIVDGETGFLVPVGDKAALARQTHVLLGDAGQRQRLGEAGRRRVLEQFAATTMVTRYAELYESRGRG